MLTKSKTIIIPTATSITNPHYFSVSAEAKNSIVKLTPSATAATVNLPSSSVALHQNILNGRFKQVKYLLKLGSKVNNKDMYGRTCLMLACLSDQEEYGLKLAKLLLQYGADVNIQDYLGRSAVCIACSNKREALVELFVDKCMNQVDFRQKDNDGNILLNHAAMYGTPRMVRLILEKMNSLYMPIDMRNNLGYTALLLAIKNKRWMNAYILLNEGHASAFLKDNEYFYNAVEWIIIVSQTNNEARNTIAAPMATSSMQQLANIKTTNASSMNNDFTLHKSHTMLSINSHSSSSSTMKPAINYKTWWGIPDPYYDFEDPLAMKCEHVPYKNLAIDHNCSKYTPAIFTPRDQPRLSVKIQQQQQRQQNNSSVFMQDSLQSFANDEENENELLFKLMDKLQEKMRSTSNSVVSSNVNSAQPSSQAISPNKLLQVPPQPGKSPSSHAPVSSNPNLQSVERTPIFITSVRSVASSAQSKSHNKRLLQQFMLKQQEGILLPNITPTRTTPKLTAAAAALSYHRSNSTIKDEIHNIFEYYTGDIVPITASHATTVSHQNSNNTVSSLSNHNRNSKLDNNNNNSNSNQQALSNSIGKNNKPNKGIIIQQQKSNNSNNGNKEVTFNLKN